MKSRNERCKTNSAYHHPNGLFYLTPILTQLLPFPSSSEFNRENPSEIYKRSWEMPTHIKIRYIEPVCSSYSIKYKRLVKLIWEFK